MISDEIAYSQYLDGNETAAEILVEKYGDALMLYINGYLKDIHDSEDLMIEAFSLMFAKARPISGNGSFKAYLFKIGRNLALRHNHKHRLRFCGWMSLHLSRKVICWLIQNYCEMRITSSFMPPWTN